MDINPRQVLIFKQVVDAGSISAGARALGWRQPSVTSHIQALERSLGLTLLLRRTTGVRPTEAGRMVLSHAAAIASHVDAMGREAEEMRARRFGSVRLAGFASTMSTRVPRALAALQSRYPDIDVALAEAEPVSALRLLDAGDADIAIVYQHVGDAQAVSLDGYTHVPLVIDPVRLIVPSRDPLAGKTPLRLADAAEYDWVISNTGCRHHLVSMCQNAGFEPRIKHASDDHLVIQQLVGYGLGVAAVTQSSLNAVMLPNVTARELDELGAHQVTAVCLPGAERVPSIKAVLEALAAVKSMAPKR